MTRFLCRLSKQFRLPWPRVRGSVANTERFTPVTDHALDHPPAADGCVLTQLVGNVAFQWALGQIGLALTVPLSMGMLLIGSAVLARLGLPEPIPPRSAAAMLLLVCSITVITWLPTRVRQGGLRRRPYCLLAAWLRSGAACLSGFTYGLGNVFIRRTLSEGAALAATLLMVSLTGVVVLGA